MGAPGAAPLAGNSFVILSVAVVGILATSLLLLAYYLFLTRCGLASWRRDHDDVVTTTQHHHHIVYSTAPEPSRGLEEAAIRRIPTLRYRESKQLQAPQAQAASECAVCLSEFQEGERLRLLPPCLHLFHTDCIDAWLHATANCPLCRTAISADHVVIDIASPSRGETSNVAGVPATIVSMGDERIDPRRDELLDVQQPMRRSLSMDSCNDKHLYLALQKVLRHHHSHSASLGEDRKGESSTPAAAASSRAAGRLRRSFLSFSHSRSSRSAILPI
uniref:RING-type E3 ubiquitin transferase n=1 Tax=Aegilops tauschii subsp. strangulata TaxID=200361 RepID=A0A453RL31_AEGTS